MGEIERITHAAVKAENGWIITGKSHADCFHKADLNGIEMSKKAIDQGFLTSKGRFVTRSEAAFIAVEAGQVNPGIKILFSEDLWSPNSGGKFRYDYVKGYYR